MHKAQSRFGILLWYYISTAFASPANQFPLSQEKAVDQSALCPQVPPLLPSKHTKLDIVLDTLYNQNVFQHSAFEALGGAIRVPTESYDDLGPVGDDPRWDTFALLHAYLERTFPQVYASLEVAKVNTYGLVFHWQGSEDTHLPVLITAHQDVVPVEPNTVDQWVQPPYSGYYDGTWIWGRGAVDDKSDLISILITVDSLLKESFKPTRTFVLAFGFDEEASSREGAGHLITYLESRYGTNGFVTLLDEGGGYGASFGGDIILAAPCTGEKGYLDARIEVTTPGGHSSVPPPHTGIGILAAAIVALESKPHPTSLARNGTAFEMLECAAAHDPNLPEQVKLLVQAAKTDDEALRRLPEQLLKLDPVFAAIMGTTQAVDLVHGGVKVNALPEKVDAVVNHRIAEDSSVEELQKRMTEILLPIASANDLTLDSFGANVTAGSGKGGHMALSDAWATSIEPAPKTPTDSAYPYQILSGTIKSALNSSKVYGNRTVIVSPSLAVGNTDTRWYWNLTRHIFRYSHIGEDDVYAGIHTVNEGAIFEYLSSSLPDRFRTTWLDHHAALLARGFVERIRFHTKFILNWDEST
ncbi:hypothetical protein NM688_g840 [Phlebia brevispora]|uniref:Uncharacterized protein n=1 Tax=Phlebia brevispora TaxID=194682 RepID=A0ACC1TDB2_9APHY|nr:hypothetical protein NM688_g840 [Phlebia brevispora]